MENSSDELEIFIPNDTPIVPVIMPFIECGTDSFGSDKYLIVETRINESTLLQMEAMLDHVPENQRRFIQKLREVFDRG